MPEEDSLLTVAIPTYGRPHELRQCIQFLRNQSSHLFHLLILDNASPVAASSALGDLLDDFPAASVRIVRNRVNIGGDANILRCFELCETEYLWVLGDDDEPLQDAVKTVYGEIGDHPDTIFFNFACELYPRTKEAVTNTLDEFISSVDSFSNILLISTSVYRRAALVPQLQIAYNYTYSMASQVVLVLRALLAESGNCRLLQKRIVKWTPPPEGTQWSVVTQLLGLGILLDLPLSRKSRRNLARLLPRPRALECMAIQVAGYRLQSKDSNSAGYIMDQIYSRLLFYSSGLAGRGRFFFYRYCLFLFPVFGLALFRLVIQVTGRGKELLNVRDPFCRL